MTIDTTDIIILVTAGLAIGLCAGLAVALVIGGTNGDKRK